MQDPRLPHDRLRSSHRHALQRLAGDSPRQATRDIDDHLRHGAREAACVGDDLPACTVQSARQFAVHDGRGYTRALYCLPDRSNPDAPACDAGYPPGGVAIFRETPDGRLELLRRHVDWQHGKSYDEPRIVENRVGMPVAAAGTGVFNWSEYYVWRDARWVRVDFAPFERDVDAVVPKGRGIWKGIWPDLDAMTFETQLWKNDDANCCPTGGAIRGALQLDGTKLRAADLRVERR
jgi:hypothetical protein